MDLQQAEHAESNADERPEEADEFTFVVPAGYCIAAKVWGPPSGRKVLALHGFLDSAATFDFLAPYLAVQGRHLTASPCRVVALDLVGHGRSDHSPTHQYLLMEYVRDCCHIIGELGWSSCSVIGHSMGGSVAMFVAAVLPKIVKHLVVIDSMPWARNESQFAEDLATSIQQSSTRHKKQARLYSSRKECVDRLIETSTHGLDRRSAETLVSRGTVRVEGGGVRFAHDLAVKKRGLMNLTRGQIASAQRAVAAETLLIRAKDGILKKVPVEIIEMQQKIDKLTVVEMSGRHHLHLETDTCDAVARLIADFLDGRLPPKARPERARL